MKVTIEGDLDQVSDVLAPRRRSYAVKGPRKNESLNSKRNRIIAEEHALLVKAFKLVRHDPDEKELAAILVTAAGDLLKRTKAVLESARQVIAQRS